MTKTFFSISATALAASLALAPAAHADAAMWQGVYAGLEVSHGSLDTNFGLPLNSGSGVSGFVGYNHAIGADFIVGAELSLGSDVDHQVVPGVAFTVESPVELQGRFGYAIGSSLIYASLGYTWADYTQTGAGISDSFEGMNYGFGLETMLAENVSMRIDYTHTEFQPGGLIYGSNLDFDSDRVAIGVAYHF